MHAAHPRTRRPKSSVLAFGLWQTCRSAGEEGQAATFVGGGQTAIATHVARVVKEQRRVLPLGEVAGLEVRHQARVAPRGLPARRPLRRVEQRAEG